MGLVTLFSLFTLAALAVTPETLELCRLHVRNLDPLIAREAKLKWDSRFLKAGPVALLGKEAAKKRAREIIDAMYDTESPLGDEFEKFFNKLTADDPSWLSYYFKSYEIFPYSPLYQSVMARAHEALPLTGRILDVGAGAAPISAFLAATAPDRKLTILDNQNATELARLRMQQLAPNSRGHRMEPIFLRPSVAIPGEPADGAIVNHVFYILVPATKKAAMKAIVDKLKPGATVVINEPIRERATPDANFKAWLTKIVTTAIDNGSPHSEFDIAFLAGMSSGRATRSIRGNAPLVSPFQSEKELESMAKDAGLDIVESGYSYDGFSRFLVLKKR